MTSAITTISEDFSGARALAEIRRQQGEAPFVICERRTGHVIANIPHPADRCSPNALIEESRARRVSLTALAV